MTDKEIIINDIDVSKCKFCIKAVKYRCGVRTLDINHLLCEENPNCNFKQHARLDAQYNAVVEQNKSLQVELNRKTQECEELKEENFTFENLIKDYEKYGVIEEIIQKLDRYRKALEEIKEIAYRLRTKRDYHSPDEINADIDSILQKCEVISSESKET